MSIKPPRRIFTRTPRRPLLRRALRAGTRLLVIFLLISACAGGGALLAASSSRQQYAEARKY